MSRVVIALENGPLAHTDCSLLIKYHQHKVAIIVKLRTTVIEVLVKNADISILGPGKVIPL